MFGGSRGFRAELLLHLPPGETSIHPAAGNNLADELAQLLLGIKLLLFLLQQLLFGRQPVLGFDAVLNHADGTLRALHRRAQVGTGIRG